MVWFSATCNSTVKLTGKIAVITGCNTGIGKVTAKDFFLRGAKVIMACRDQEKAKQTLDDILKTSENTNQGELLLEELDLSSLRSVRSCAERISNSQPKIDILVNNAGVMMCPKGTTEDGFETQLGTNHLGHFLFTLLLLPKIIKSEQARIVIVSSKAHNRGVIDFEDLNWQQRPYSPLGAYSQSKLANVLFAKELDRKLKEHSIKNVHVYSLHPGVIRTELGRHIQQSMPIFSIALGLVAPIFFKTPEQGAQTTIYCAVDEQCAQESGLYYSNCAIAAPARVAENQADAKRLWNESLKLVGLSEDDTSIFKTN